MKSKFITDPEGPFDDFLNRADAGFYASFSPLASPGGVNAFARAPVEIPLTPAVVSEAVAASTAQGSPGSNVSMTAGGITFNLLYDAAAMAAPQSFRSGIQQAASLLTAAISDKITVNIKIDYSGTGGGAAAGPDNGLYETYSSVKADLINNATLGDTIFGALPGGTSIQGQSDVAVWNAQLKLWGIIGANDTTTDDGSATFATDISPGLLVGVALHELTHALARVPYGTAPDVFDVFRFSSPGVRMFDGGNTASAAYFSIDGGNTKLADFGQNSDPSDFLNSGVQGPNDPFNEFYTGSTSQQLTGVDLKQLDALGFHVIGTDTTAPSLVHDGSITLAVGAMATIPSSQLQFDDNDNTHAQEIYTVLSGPTLGTLLKSGSGTASFTQADIDNGLISYHENGSVTSSDCFTFRVTDTAGNTTNTMSFEFNISHAPIFAEPAFHFSDFAPGAGGWSSNNLYPRELADVNGDHNIDIVGFGDAGVSVAPGNGDGSFGPSSFKFAEFGAGSNAGGWSSNDLYPREVADVNGDGMADIVGFGDRGVYVALATGGGSFGPSSFKFSGFGPSAGGWSSNDLYPRELADVNGDHKIDIVGFGDAGVSVALGNGDGSFGPSSFKFAEFGAGSNAGGWTNNDLYPRLLADVNGDGMADIVGFGDRGVYVALATGNGSFGPSSLKLASFGTGSSAGGWSSNDLYPRELADVNGDGKIDIVGFGAAGVYVALGNGDGSFQPAVADLHAFAFNAGGWSSEDKYPRLLADVNRDGAADIVGFGYSGVSEALSNGFHLI